MKKNLLFLFCVVFSASISAQETVDEVVEYIINDFARNYAFKPQKSGAGCVGFGADTIIVRGDETFCCKRIVVDVVKISNYDKYLMFEDGDGRFFSAWPDDFSPEVFVKMQTLRPKKLKLFYDYRNIVIKYEEI